MELPGYEDFCKYRNATRSLLFHHTREFMTDRPYRRKIPLEYHDFYEIIYFNSSCDVSYVIEGEAYRPRQGDILLINANECHAVTIDLNDETGHAYDRYVLQLNKNALPFDPTILEQLETIFSPDYRLIPSEFVERHECRNYIETLDALCRNERETYFNGNLIIVTLQLIMELHKSFSEFSTVNAKRRSSVPIVENAIRYIGQNIKNNITLDTISKDLFVSKFYLSRLFSEYMHISIKQYIIIKKMHYADSLIRQGMTAQQACTAIGYNYYTSFYHSYRKVFGRSPTHTDSADAELSTH